MLCHVKENIYKKQIKKTKQNKKKHPEVYHDFMAGHHVMRRSDRYWAGLSCDLVIEQTLMRTLKSNGGLTRGRGMGERQRLVWLLSIPASATAYQWMQSLTQTEFTTSEQHKDSSETRQEKDHKDTLTVINYVSSRNPFCADMGLRSIATGQAADSSVNADQAVEIGQRILQGMTDQSAADVTFKKSNQAVTMATKTGVTIGQEMVQVDPQLLFQRLVQVAGNDTNRLEEMFYYELANVPASLFDSTGFPREANKHTLAGFLWSAVNETASLPRENVKYILDGGSLLHRLPWPRGSSYKELAEMYVSYVARKHTLATIIFDGYVDGPSTKDVAHLRRSKGLVVGRHVAFDPDMILCETKEIFLANCENKQQFIHLLAEAFEANKFVTFHAKGDADCLIVAKALVSAKESATVVVGEDTDLLVLLLHHVEPTMHDVFFTSGSYKKTKL